MRMAIVDDLSGERRLLRDRLETALKRRNVRAEFFEYENGEDFINAAMLNRFSAAFLDIYMDGIDGVETAKRLRAFDVECLLVFTTTSTDHALQGFQVRAMDYLVKPFAEDEIDRLTGEMLARLPRPDTYLEIRINGSDIRLSCKSIVYAEHFAHMIYVHTAAQKTLITRRTFQDFIAPLRNDARFFICGRGVIANLEHAADFDGNAFIMDDGSRVVVSRDLAKTARQALMEFLIEGRR